MIDGLSYIRHPVTASVEVLICRLILITRAEKDVSDSKSKRANSIGK